MDNKIHLELPEGEILNLLEIYQEKLNKLDKEREDTLSMITYLRGISMRKTATIIGSQSLFLGTDNVPAHKSKELVKLANGYIKQWPWNKKILFVLKAVDKAMTAKEIGDYILSELEPELMSSKKRVLSTVSGQVSTMFAKHKTLNRVENELDQFEYEIAK